MSEDATKLPPAIHLKYPGGYCRPVEIMDALFIYIWVNDPDVRIFLNRTMIEMFEEEEDWIKNLHKRKQQNQVWMICLDDGTRVGTIGLHNIDFRNGTATTGAMFGNKELQGKGIGQKAKMAILAHVFNVLNLRQVYSDVLGFNTRSMRYSERCGYKVIARLPNHIRLGDEYFDHVIMVVTREEWLPLWEKFRKKHQIESFVEMLNRTMKPRT